MARRVSTDRRGAATDLLRAAVLLMLAPWSCCLADIATDGSVGPATGLGGPDFRIGSELGTTSGSNLFHSFRVFDVHTGESATFTGPASIANVISRVTGGRMSTIDGHLRSEVGQADFFFINPAGVVFGPNARVDVPAAFHVSTADELRFADGSVYSATDPEKSTLSMAAPESFGFLSPQPASIEVNGSTLKFAPGQTVSISAGDVAIAGGDTSASVRVQGGEIRISAVGDRGGGVPLVGAAEQPGNGSLHVEYARIDTSGDGGGTLIVRAGRATLFDATLAADNLSDTDATTGIDLEIAGPLAIHASRMQSNAFASGTAGSVRVTADSLEIRQAGAETFTGIFSEVEPGVHGSSGGIEVTVDGSLEMRGAVGIDASTYGEGDANGVRVAARELLIDGEEASVFYRGSNFGTGIAADTGESSGGNAAEVSVAVSERLSIINSGGLSSSTLGAGDAGTVQVSASELYIDGGDGGSLAGIAAVTFSEANAGSVSVTVAELAELRNGALILGSTFAEGHGGRVSVQATELELVNGAQISSSTFAVGNAGSVLVQAGKLRIDDEGTSGQSTGITSQAASGSSGDAGSIEVTVTGLLELLDGAEISSSTVAVGNAGSVLVQAGELRIDDRGTPDQVTGIFSNANSGSSGDAGSVEVAADGLLELLDGAQISAGTVNVTVAGPAKLRNGASILGSTFAEGHGGRVSVQAAEMELVDGAEIGNRTSAAGHAGDVAVTVDGRLELRDGAQITSSTFAEGHGGRVSVQAAEVKLASGAEIGSGASAAGDAGDVAVTVTGLLELRDGAEISSITSGGDAGNIVIQAGELSIDGEGTSGQLTWIANVAESGSSGHAGDVTVTVDGLLELRNRALIANGTAAEGHGGRVSVQAAEVELVNVAQIRSSTFADGNAGNIAVTVDGPLELRDGAQIVSNTSADGNAGSVAVGAGELHIDGEGTSGQPTWLASIALPDSSGDAGDISVMVDGLLELRNGALIAGSTFSEGHGGRVSVQAAEVELINRAQITGSTHAVGDAGSVAVRAGELRVDGQGVGTGIFIFSQSNSGSSGDAGSIEVTVDGLLELLNGAVISSRTQAVGNAGSVAIEAGALRIDGQGVDTGIVSQTSSGSGGEAGDIEVKVDSFLELINGAGIRSGTHAVGNAGNVLVRAGAMRIDGQGAGAEIISQTNSGSSGDAGDVEVTVDGFLELINGAGIRNGTHAVGNAGNVLVRAGAMRIDGQGNPSEFTGIASQSDPDSGGDAGNVAVTVDGVLELLDGAQIGSSTFAAGDAGYVLVQAGELRIDGEGAPDRATGIGSQADSGSSGDVGDIEVTVDGLLELLDGAVITSETFAAGNAGSILVQAGALRIDDRGTPDHSTGISSNTSKDSGGHAGNVTVAVDGLLELLDGAVIRGDTFATGNAGSVSVQAGALRIDDRGTPDQFTGISSDAKKDSGGHAGNVTVTVTGLLELLDGASISSSTFAAGDAGSVMVQAGALRIDGEGVVKASTGSEGDAGDVLVTVTGLLELLDGASIASSTFAAGDAGSVMVQAGALRIDGQGVGAGIASQANSPSSGDAGSIEVRVDGLLELLNGAQISSSTLAVGDAGSVLVQAGELRIDSQGNPDQVSTAIASEAAFGSGGHAGDTTVTVDGLLELLDGASISSSTFAGDAGSVVVQAGELRIDGRGDPGLFTRISSNANPGSSGDAGSVEVTVAGLLELFDGADISSGTFAVGEAGSVAIRAEALRIDGKGTTTGVFSTAEPDSSGNAGSIGVTVAGLLELLDGAVISSNTSAAGDAGDIAVRAEALRIDGGGTLDLVTGIGSIAGTGSGDAGSVTVEVAGRAELLDGAQVSTESDGGDAGTVSLHAADLLIDGRGRSTGMSSRALTNATGHVGSIDVEVGGLEVLGGGEITIDADQTLAFGDAAGDRASHIRIAADSLSMDGGRISARSTGNVPASRIDISAGEMSIEGVSRITTESNQADAGPITIDVADLLWLRNSEITTSVLGETGDGGDITLRSDFVILEGGFVQANTAAQGARGGNILIDARALVASQGVVEIGGAQRQVFEPGSGRNVIQAAAPGGEQGLINITAPELDITASLVPLATPFDDPDDLITNACLTAAGEQASSLVERGAGGVPAAAAAPAVVSFAGRRLDRILDGPAPSLRAAER